MSDLAEIREKHGAFMDKFGCDVKVAWPTVYALLGCLPSLADEIERLRNEIAGNDSLIGRMAAAIQLLLRAQIKSGDEIERLTKENESLKTKLRELGRALGESEG